LCTLLLCWQQQRRQPMLCKRLLFVWLACKQQPGFV
jgi:hypothetical protein